MMREWLGRPHRLVEWVTSSFLSTMILSKLWLAAVCLALFTDVCKGFQDKALNEVLLGSVALAALATHGLLWWQVLRGAWALCRGADASDAWLVAGAVLWLLLLLGFQLLCVLAWYAISTPSTSSEPWLKF